MSTFAHNSANSAPPTACATTCVVRETEAEQSSSKSLAHLNKSACIKSFFTDKQCFSREIAGWVCRNTIPSCTLRPSTVMTDHCRGSRTWNHSTFSNPQHTYAQPPACVCAYIATCVHMHASTELRTYFYICEYRYRAQKCAIRVRCGLLRPSYSETACRGASRQVLLREQLAIPTRPI